jgi:hypothetical protein
LSSSDVTDIIYKSYKAETHAGTPPMARLPTFEFTNWRDPEGYRISDRRPAEPRRIVRKGKGATPWVPLHPLAKTRDLFLIFARTANTAEGLLSFIQTYGPLTYYGNAQGELVDDLIIHAGGMRGLIDSISSHALRDPALEGNYDVAPGCTVNAVVVWDSIGKNYRWEFRPSTLLDGLYLQMGEAITRGAQIGKCAHCGDWFEAGQGAGRRAGAKFCSDDHKITYHSLRRSREK